MARGPTSGEGHDPSRREFFRTVTRQTVTNAGAVVGAANELQRTSLAAARELLEVPEPVAGGRSTVTRAEASAPAPAPDFRSAYRYTGDAIVVLDQRELPGRTVTFEAREPNPIAASIRLGAVTAGPVLGELAAYAVALSARRASDRTTAAREQVVRAAAGTLRSARRDVRALVAAVDRMESRYDVLASGGATGAEIADGLTAEAEAIAATATLAHAQVGRLTAEAIAAARGDALDATGERPIHVLMHGDAGPLTCGMVGMSTTCFRSLLDAGAGLHVWVTAAAPANEGVRVAAYQLAQSDVPHTVIPDTAVGWLLANEPVDAVLLRADAVARNGDTAALVGALQVAQLARAAGVPVLAFAPRASLDPDLPDLEGFLPSRGIPIADVVPAALIRRVLTEAPTEAEA